MRGGRAGWLMGPSVGPAGLSAWQDPGMLPHAGLEIRCSLQPELAQAPNNQELTRAWLGTGSEICLGFASESDQVANDKERLRAGARFEMGKFYRSLAASRSFLLASAARYFSRSISNRSSIGPAGSDRSE